MLRAPGLSVPTLTIASRPRRGDDDAK